MLSGFSFKRHANEHVCYCIFSCRKTKIKVQVVCERQKEIARNRRFNTSCTHSLPAFNRVIQTELNRPEPCWNLYLRLFHPIYITMVLQIFYFLCVHWRCVCYFFGFALLAAGCCFSVCSISCLLGPTRRAEKLLHTSMQMNEQTYDNEWTNISEIDKPRKCNKFFH